MIIEYWSDFSCPFCYIAEARIKRAMREMGIEDQCRMDFRSFRLNPMAKQVPSHPIFDSYAKRYGPESAGMQIERIEEMAAGEGLEFHYGTAWNSNTMDAHRLVKHAYATMGKASGDAFADRLYEAFFRENRVLADRSVLLSIAEEMGMDADDAGEVLDSDRYRDLVLADEAVAHSFGVTAVPFFAVNRRYGIPGAVDIDDFKRILRAALDEEDADISEGSACGPDGCR